MGEPADVPPGGAAATPTGETAGTPTVGAADAPTVESVPEVGPPPGAGDGLAAVVALIESDSATGAPPEPAEPAETSGPLEAAGTLEPTGTLEAAGTLETAGTPPARAPVDTFPLWPEQVARHVPGPRQHGHRRGARPDRAPRVRKHKPPRRAAVALPAVVLLGLVSAFFAWVTAEPFWLTTGHAESGTATVTGCQRSGRCVGSFDGGDFTAARVTLAGIRPEHKREGTAVPARMTSARGDAAYVGGNHGARTALGLALLVLCGLGIVWATGALRLPGRRVLAVLACLAGPLVLLVGMLAVTY